MARSRTFRLPTSYAVSNAFTPYRRRTIERRSAPRGLYAPLLVSGGGLGRPDGGDGADDLHPRSLNQGNPAHSQPLRRSGSGKAVHGTRDPSRYLTRAVLPARL